MLRRLCSPRSASSLAIAVIAGMVLAGCAKPGDPEVGVQALNADIVFGAPKKGDAIPNTEPLDTPAVPFEEIGEFEPAPRVTTPRVRTTRPAPLCRTATVNDFAKESAPDKVTTRPTEGVYLWKRSGTQTIDGQEKDLTGFEERTVRNVKTYREAEGSFEYETVQQALDGSTQVIKWRVRPVGTKVGDTNVNSNVNSPGVVPFSQNIGEPDRGLSIVSITTTTKDGAVTSFEPLLPLLYLPLAPNFDPGLNWTAIAIDPRSLSTIQLDGGVVGHSEVDACGTVLDAWKVQATLTYVTSAGQMQVSYQYQIATQFGALLVGEQITSPATGPTLRAQFNIGQVTPKPLPATAG